MIKDEIKYIDLFAGVGGFRLGIEKAERNNKCVFTSEIDKYAIQTYNKNFKTSIEPNDITKQDANSIPDFDLLCGGFPCQAFSIAGKRRGFEDTRGTMFYEIARIVKVKKPKYILLENVKGLLSHDRGRTFAIILTTMSELGYDVQWMVLNSKFFGVPQNRERVFIIGNLRGTGRSEILPFGEGGEDVTERNKSNTQTSDTLSARYWKGGAGTHIQQLNKPKHSNDRIYGQEGISPSLNTAQGGRRQPMIPINSATSQGYSEAKAGDGIRLEYPESKTARGRVIKGNSNTLKSGSEGVVDKDMRIRRLTPIECERLQGFPDNWTKGVSDTQRYKQMGNAVTVNVVEAIIGRMFK